MEHFVPKYHTWYINLQILIYQRHNINMPRAYLNVPHLSWDQEPFLGNTNKNWNKYEEQNHHHWHKKKK